MVSFAGSDWGSADWGSDPAFLLGPELGRNLKSLHRGRFRGGADRGAASR